jgi:hypothetical protein
MDGLRCPKNPSTVFVCVFRLREKGMASHGRTVNVEIPGGLDAILRWVRTNAADALIPYVRSRG